MRQNILQSIGINEDATAAMIWEILNWFKGDYRIGVLADFTVAPSSTSANNVVGPPDETEEWMILWISVQDLNSKDVADVVNFSHVDWVIDPAASNPSWLQTGTLQAPSGAGNNQVLFPNRDVSKSFIDYNGNTQLVARKRGTTLWMAPMFTYISTATAGNRSVRTRFGYLRRRLK